MANRHSETHELDGVSFRFEALPFDRATDILADVLQVVSRTLEAGISQILPLFKSGKLKLDSEGLEKILPLIVPALVAISNELAASKSGTSMLKWLEPKLFETTTAIMKDERGAKSAYQLMNADDRATVFDAHPSAYLLALLLAGKVSFARYFPVAAAAAGGSTSPAAAEKGSASP